MSVGVLVLLTFGLTSQADDPLGFQTATVPAGSVMMGCLPGDELCVPFEKPRHKVTISHKLEVMTTEVTQGLYQTVIGSNPSRFTECGPQCPVENVNWEDAILFANKLSKLKGLTPCYKFERADIVWDIETCTGWRLPTEAEWEYLARGGKEDLYSGGSEIEDLGWVKSNSNDELHPVAQKKANAFGLYDMSGNVFEWVWDYYGQYPSTEATNPVGPEGGMVRGCRGGGWSMEAKFARSSRRMRDDPSVRSGFIGLRLVRKR
ncbi:MAG: formylglycine-generating enzyme family protein [Myxococcota bacterium]